GRHEHERVAATDDVPDDLGLGSTERAVPEDPVQGGQSRVRGGNEPRGHGPSTLTPVPGSTTAPPVPTPNPSPTHPPPIIPTNGSRCSHARAPAAVACSTELGSSSNPNSDATSDVDQAKSSRPLRFLISISHATAALTYTLLSGSTIGSTQAASTRESPRAHQ